MGCIVDRKYWKIIVIGLVITGFATFISSTIQFDPNPYLETDEDFTIYIIGMLITFAYGSGPFFLIAWLIKRQHLKPVMKN